MVGAFCYGQGRKDGAHMNTYVTGAAIKQLREKCGIDSKTVRRLKANENMETKTLNKLCAMLGCNVV